MSNNCLQRSNYLDTVYVGCSETDLLYGAKLGSIVRYLFRQLNLKPASSDESFRAYCDALDDEVGDGIFYGRDGKINCTSKASVLDLLKKMLPNAMHHLPQYEKMAQMVTETTSSARSIDQVEHPGHLFIRDGSKSESDNYFSVIKIFRNGDNLEIIPCYMSIYSWKSVGGFLFFRSTKEYSEIKYRQCKYCLDKYDIMDIIDEIKENARFKWN